MKIGGSSKLTQVGLPDVTREPDHPHPETEGTVETSSSPYWSSLPFDMVDKILVSLSLWELAGISATCKQFDELFRQKLVNQQEVRCDLAIQRFGKQRVSSIADTAYRFLKGQPLDLSGEEGSCWLMSQDGKWHPVEPLWQRGTLQEATLKAGDIAVTLDKYEDCVLFIDVAFPTGSFLAMDFSLQSKDVSCKFYLKPSGDDDVEGVALVQALVKALLSGEFAPFAEQAGRLPHVHIPWGDYKDGFTHAGLQNLVAPLVPLASQYIVRESAMGNWESVTTLSPRGKFTLEVAL